MDLDDLRAFDRIADLSGISAAARSLRRPKSSVSRSLLRLDEAIGAVLVERSTRHLRLTDAGLLLQRHARRILEAVGDAENVLGRGPALYPSHRSLSAKVRVFIDMLVAHLESALRTAT